MSERERSRIKMSEQVKGQQCPYCHGDLEERDLMCPSCLTVYHPDCWDEHGGCSMLGCENAPQRSREVTEAKQKNETVIAEDDDEARFQATSNNVVRRDQHMSNCESESAVGIVCFFLITSAAAFGAFKLMPIIFFAGCLVVVVINKIKKTEPKV